MSFDPDSKEQQGSNTDHPTTNLNQNLSQPYFSLLKSRQATIERLDLKGITTNEKSSTSDSSPTLASSIEDPQKEIIRTNEYKETKNNTDLQNPNSQENSNPDKTAEPSHNAYSKPPSQEFFLRNSENLDQSPRPQKSQNVAPLEFSIVLKNDILPNQKEEVLFASQSNLDTSKLKSQSRLLNDYTILEVIYFVKVELSQNLGPWERKFWKSIQVYQQFG